MHLSIEPISSVDHIDDLATIIQLSCIFHGEIFESDLQWDDDLIFQTFLEARKAEGDDADTLNDYEAEPNRTIQLAKEQMVHDARSILHERSILMSVHFPFEISSDIGKLLSLKEVVDGSGTAYLWLLMFDLLNSDTNYIQLSADDENFFKKRFYAVFEIIACYALSGRNENYVWCTGRIRSASSYLNLLRRILGKVGSGVVKELEKLDENQINVNEAGVDGVALSTVDGVVGNDAEIIILQSTVQKGQRRTKVVGPGQVTRFKSFFEKNPRAAVHGALAIPYEGTAIDQADCAEANCIYLPRSEILKYIGREPTDTGKRLGTWRLDAIMRSHNKVLSERVRLITVDGQLPIG